MTTEALDAATEALIRDFRGAMGNVSAAVSVVTTLFEDEPYGSTVSAFTSISMEPPILMVSLDNRSSLLPKLHIGSVVGVNVLAAHQDQLALRFAQSRDDKFADIAWTVQDGAPAFADKHAWIAITIHQLMEIGDHTIALGDVVAADSFQNAALTYWQRTFGTHHGF